MELKICVDVISDVIAQIGKVIPQVETFLNDNFNIYGGCLRLAYAKYDIHHQRFQVTISFNRSFHLFPLFTLKIEGNGKSNDKKCFQLSRGSLT